MTDVIFLLTNKYPQKEERIEGCLMFLTKYGIAKLDRPTLQQKTRLEFYKAKFSTGYRKFSLIDVIVGLSIEDNQIYLLTNPIFSDRYSNLITQFEKIEGHISQTLIDEIISLFKETGVDITEIDRNKNKYQIWFGSEMWRIMTIEREKTLKLKTKPNSSISKSAYRFFRQTFG